MEDRLMIVQERPLRDLIALGREAATALQARGSADRADLALADALDGAASAVAVDLHEEARLPAVPPIPV